METIQTIEKKEKTNLAGNIYSELENMMPSCGNICDCACFCHCSCWITNLSEDIFHIELKK